MSNKINLFINSKNRKDDENSSKFTVVIPDGLLYVANDEYFSISVINFHIFNQFYNIRNGYNNQCQIFRNNEASTEISFTEGNYNALNLLPQLNEKLVHLTVTYDKNKNKYSFYNHTGQSYTLVIINCHKLLGFKPTTRNIEIPSHTTIISEIPVNFITDTILNLSISGDIELQGNNIHNYRNTIFEPSSIIYQKYISDIPFGLSLYSNEDGGDNYKYVLNNRDSINYFTLEISNQDLETIDGLPEYFLTIQFEKHKKNNIDAMLDTIINYLKNYFQMFGLILEHFKIF